VITSRTLACVVLVNQFISLWLLGISVVMAVNLNNTAEKKRQADHTGKVLITIAVTYYSVKQ